MPANTRKSEAPRPTSVNDNETPTMCEDCARQQKIDTALALVAMMLDHTKPGIIAQPSGESLMVARELKPKETSTYMAALDWLERYLDSPNPGH